MGYESIVTWYINVICSLSEILHIVPYNETNKTVIIPRLSSIIIESGSLLDTIFYSLYLGKKKKPTIVDFKDYYEPLIKLSTIRTLFYAEQGIIFQPFECWSKCCSIVKTERYSPIWWRSYNKLKHDRSNNMEESTLENAVNICVALTQLLARNVEFFMPLNRHELIISNTNPEYIKSNFNAHWEEYYSEISLENNLFLTPFGKDIFKKDSSEINTNIIHSKRLRTYYSRWG